MLSLKSTFGMRELHEEDVLAMSAPSNSTTVCGVYFLIHDEEIVYVGQSSNLLARVESHKVGADRKVFNKVAFIEAPRPWLDTVEAFYIQRFDPPYNNRSRVPRDSEPRTIPCDGCGVKFPIGQAYKTGYGLFCERKCEERAVRLASKIQAVVFECVNCRKRIPTNRKLHRDTAFCSIDCVNDFYASALRRGLSEMLTDRLAADRVAMGCSESTPPHGA